MTASKPQPGSATITELVEDFVERAERALRCGMTPKFLREWARREGILEYVQIHAAEALRGADIDSTDDN